MDDGRWMMGFDCFPLGKERELDLSMHVKFDHDDHD